MEWNFGAEIEASSVAEGLRVAAAEWAAACPGTVGQRCPEWRSHQKERRLKYF